MCEQEPYYADLHFDIDDLVEVRELLHQILQRMGGIAERLDKVEQRLEEETIDGWQE